MAGMKLYSLDSGDPRQLGPYRLLRRIATGGMGRIYLARREAPGSPASAAGPTGTVVDPGIVAVKTLLAQGFVSRPDRARFAREVELAGRVDSEYTATVLEADAKAERPWLAIEFIPAPSLADLVDAAGTLPADGVRWVAAGAARALVELHALGVVHRDIKPLNILLPHEGPRLIDFGISHAHDHTSSTTTIGTFAFTSPEQASGRKSTAASDMYSLGATLFFLAVGRPPYEQTDHSIGVLALVQRGETDTSGLPPELAPLILPLLEPDPERRPAPSKVLRDCLDRLDGLDRFDRLDRERADRDAGRWLPERWTELIGAYADQGRQLVDGSLDLAAAEALTEVRSEAGEEGADEALSEMREQLEALRSQRDALVRAQAEERAEAEARDRAREEEEELKRRERARKEEAERRERERKEQARLERERKEAERKEKARKEAELKEKQRKERERLAREKTATAGKSAGTTSAPTSTASGAAKKPPAKKSDPMESWGGLLVGALVIGLLIWQPWNKKDDNKPSTSPTPSFSQPLSSSDGGTGGLDDDESLGAGDSDTSSGSSSSSGGGSEPDPETSSPEPDPTEEAFKAVSHGECLDVVDTGYGGQSTYDWSEEEPNTTSCSIARVRVTSTTGDCTKRNDQTSWSYYSTSSGERTELCLTGEYHVGDCVLANRQGDTASVALLSSVNCTDRKVPSGYNDIFVITAIYSGSSNCSAGQYDSNTYWSWKVGGGSTLLCMRAYD
ncbi:protein kinase domain-containing protein [Streptomyces coffeae]|uniref:Protein kinase n=1 Tax=Streptomyces coffeae TaxID=621382 RepID=A0ABS1NEK7_9ACTN|nr:protein kinase [Streptomyces coffeae]MBL1098508.1 protein kinase [Streptomyces coffeae]